MWNTTWSASTIQGSSPNCMRFSIALAFLALLFTSPMVTGSELPTTGEGLYEIGCAKCHGKTGTGVPLDQVGFDVPLPDLTDCSFATREPDFDWIAVSHQGGPVRGFDFSMPAFGEAFDVEQLQKIVDFIRTFCTDDVWPRGELNLPRPLFTEKAYPEDELVWTTGVAEEESGGIVTELLYERRFGSRNQWELAVPFGATQATSDSPWIGGVGDITVGVKSTVYHRLDRGNILSLNAELGIPTGNEERGQGKGVWIFEPSVSFGQLLPAETFVHLQAGIELPSAGEQVDEEIFWTAVFGRTFTVNTWGRSWTPMVEVIGRSEDGSTDWDVVPQVQVSLNTRQHVLANVGVLVPLDDDAPRPRQVFFYLLWEWFDGGLLDGW